ncbi:MAG TPA: CoA-transferase [Acidimicrobiales bacterium]|nr:CoA-transferase [Acidimicrobiales bacterium]
MSGPAPPSVATPTDKSMTADEVVARLRSGSTLGIGGWGSRRKPMALVKALLRSDVTDLHVVSYGGPEIGVLAAAGRLRHLTFAFVSPDVPNPLTGGDGPGLDPHFRAARQAGRLQCTELDEGMMLLGLQAAAWRLPFLPTRVGLGSDLFRLDPSLRTVRSPYPGPDGGPGEELVAQPAIALDAAWVHLNVGDTRGNAAFTGPDLYFDDLLLEAAAEGYVSLERTVPTAELSGAAGDITRLRVNRMFVTGVVEAPGGARPTGCAPDYDRDEAWQARWFATAKDEAARAALLEGWAAS